ncbi:hypothetical protein SAMN05421866_2703 [Chryseobacterium oranimense]|uniref:Uncharacterized protein n=1 Tax=Chryseobacterium oranimense TaxID=421058 RepID=A0A1M5SBY7_9FLAO|nr:hypothetical protein [Chryseobacterium oranimense]SHH35798.1 hypothetical protein SAMN05421866_2703 [Chryseobacterium oranimense]
MNSLSLKSLIIIPVGVGLIFTMLINGWTLLTGGDTTHLEYLNYYNRTNVDQYPSYYTILLYLTAVLQLIASVFLAIALIEREFLADKNAKFFKWGIFFSILSVVLYGFMVRLLSNHGASATMYFYVGVLYFCLWYIEQNDNNLNHKIFTRIKILPIYFTIFYTMGFPGWQKIVNSTEVMGGYIKLFSNSFLSKIPGGIEPFIYFLGILEISVPILLILSLIKKEFLLNIPTQFLDWSIFISVCTFVMLSLGLGVVLNYPGSTNLIFYAVFTMGLYSYICTSKRAIKTCSL